MLSEEWNNSTPVRRSVAILLIMFHILAVVFIIFFLIQLSVNFTKPHWFYICFISIFILFESYIARRKDPSDTIFILFWQQLKYSVKQALSGSLLAILVHVTEESIPIAEISIKIILHLVLVLDVSLFFYFIITELVN